VFQEGKHLFCSYLQNDRSVISFVKCCKASWDYFGVIVFWEGAGQDVRIGLGLTSSFVPVFSLQADLALRVV
jgi:hypothetical protein